MPHIRHTALVVTCLLLLLTRVSWGGPPPNPTGNVDNQLNTANGPGTLNFNTTGHSNTATGAFALNANTTGHSNTAGYFNTATGRFALYSNTTLP